MLEGIHWTEAEVVCLAKDRKLDTKYKSLKEDFIREVWPDLLPPKVKEVAPTKKSVNPSKDS
jgi:hypothetical protein